MSYLQIKQSDTKTFKAFMSGHQIEVGVVVQSETDVFGTGDEIEVFYGNENCDTYRAEIRGKKKLPLNNNAEHSYLMLSVLKR
jgi:hypothetical protein